MAAKPAKKRGWRPPRKRPWNRPPAGAESGPVLSLVDPSLRRGYEAYLRSATWKKKRAEALLRWGGLCENCGVRAAREVHHKTYERLGNERLSDLSPLCSECHQAEHPEASPRDRGKERPSMGRRARSTADIDRPHDSGQ